MEKAYKLLSQKHYISHNKAKALIDRGLVSANGKRLTLARTLLSENTHFVVQEIAPLQILHQEEALIALDKPTFLESYEIEKRFAGYQLLHRLDKETSGVLLFGKRENPLIPKVKEAFKQRKAQKLYYALVNGIVADEICIDAPILTKKGSSAKSKVHKNGLSAITHIKPESIRGKQTLLEVRIESGRTHQIRVHLAHIGYPILGDTLYGGASAKRLMLHAHKLKVLDYVFCSKLPQEFCLN